MSVWLCLCVSLSEHVQTPMLKRLRARESTAAAQFAGFFLATFPASFPTSWTARPAEYATPPMLKRLRARESTAAAQFAGFFLATFPASFPTFWTARPAEYATPHAETPACARNHSGSAVCRIFRNFSRFLSHLLDYAPCRICHACRSF